ncbi:hypothetical protein [Paenibacillus tengchongensis]|uniref:hypothetical protein n=1 Tax=Paenibacillus tengchongensis TaxID=2608684 RepID=UPI00124D044E|nr:hypothetical protein [Paenibacillus tengchongensis]
MAGRLKMFIPLGLFAATLSACSPAPDRAEGSPFSTLSESIPAETVYLPEDLPIPAEAGITFSEGKLVDGKKSGMLIYETKESMTLLGSTYQKYLGSKHLEHGTQIIEPGNLLISGKVPGSYSYSIIGSRFAGDSGDTEIIVTWLDN